MPGTIKTRTAQQNAIDGTLMGECDPSKRFRDTMNLKEPPVLDATWNIGTVATVEAVQGANPDWLIIGTNAANANVTGSTRGGLNFVTAGSAADTIAIQRNNAAETESILDAVTFATDDELIWRAVIVTGANISDTVIIGGFLLTLDNEGDFTATNDADAVFFRYEDGVNGGRLQCCLNFGTASGSYQAADSKTTALAVSTIYDLAIVVNADRKASFYVDSRQAVGFQDSETLDTAVDLEPHIGIDNPTSAGAKAFQLLHFSIGKNRSA